MVSNFKADLTYGQLGEAFVASLGADTSIEVKRDRMSLDTGNIFLEVSCNGKASGIMSTEASYWVHLLPKGAKQVAGYILDVKALKTALQSLINDGSTIVRKKDWSGDGGRVVGYIISLNDIGLLIKEMASAS